MAGSALRQWALCAAPRLFVRPATTARAPLMPRIARTRRLTTAASSTALRAPPSALEPTLAVAGGDRPPASVFVSSYFELQPNEVTELVQRSHLEHRTSDTQVSLKTCLVCDLEERAKPEHQWHFVINKRNGSYHCRKCQASGSWFDLRQHVHGHVVPGSAADGGAEGTAARPADTAWRRAQQELQTSPVLAQLTGHGLKVATLQHYGVGATPGSPSEPPRAVFAWTASGATVTSPRELVRLAYCDPQDSGFRQLEPRQGDVGLFGWSTVPLNASELVLTTNELDAMAVWQSTGRPAVALPMGTSLLPVALLPMLERFTRLYLWFSDDVPGQEAVERMGRKLGRDRCLVVRSHGGNTDEQSPKTALEALARGMDLGQLLRTATPLEHRQIVRFENFRNEVLNEILNPTQVAGVPSQSLPTLTKILKGHRRGELTILTGPTGIGKTSVLSQLSLDYCLQGVSTLWGSFEIRNNRLMKKMLCQLANKNFVGNADDFHIWADRFEQLPMHFLKFFGSTSVDEVLEAMEHAHYVHDVGHVILDNLQFMTSGQGKGYERFEIHDRALHLLRAFATSRNVHVTLVIHPRKEDDAVPLSISDCHNTCVFSSVFGTAKATQEADNLIVIQRGKRYRYLDVKKNRFDGELGIVPYRFDKNSGRIIELAPAELQNLPLASGSQSIEM